MNGIVERELKLEAPDGFSLARLPHHLRTYVASPAQFRRLHTVYYDTADLRLMRWGCSLRYRRGEGWTLKIPVPTSSKALIREEHVFEGSEERVPQAALDLATAYLRGERVAPVAELRTVRVLREFRDCEGDELADVVEDDVRVVEGSKVTKRFRQVEIELEDSVDADALDAIADALRSEGAGRPNPIPKDEFAIAGGKLAPEIAIPDLDARSQTHEVVCAALGQSVIQLVRYDAKLRLSDDAEAVHQARVAVRRMRSNLRTFLPVLECDWACTLRERLRWLQEMLSPVRDADVQIENLQRTAEELPPTDFQRSGDIFAALRAARSEACEQLLRALRGARYVSLLNDLVDAAQRPHVTEMAGELACDVVSSLMQYAFKTARKAVRRAGRLPSDRELHVIRIKSKHLRYASEAFSPVVGRAATGFACKVEALQNVLGEQHDSVVAVTRLRGFSGTNESVFVAGELAALASKAGMAACSQWRKAWREIERKRSRFWSR